MARQPVITSALAFRPEFLDFRRGIRVGKLEDNQRITRILKLALEERYREPFITERYGRGMFWQWIGFLPRSNRLAKPVSHDVSFGCSKFFLMVDTEEKQFRCGFQVERGYVRATAERRAFVLREDWDWHRLVAGMRPRQVLAKELERLVVEEGFRIHAGTWEDPARYGPGRFPGATRICSRLEKAAARQWAGFQLFYSMTEDEVLGTPGPDLVEAMLAVFAEVTPAMNLTMQVALRSSSE